MTLRPAFALALVLATLSPAAALADTRTERYAVAQRGSSIRAGAARTDVHAPLDVVRKVVTDFDGYSQHIKRFEKSHVVGRHGPATDVYLQVPILKGAAKVWAIVRFQPERGEGGEELIVGRMLKGNVKALDARIRLAKIDDANTRLGVELHIVPDLAIPVPGSVVTGQVASAAEKAVRGLRKRSESVGAE